MVYSLPIPVLVSAVAYSSIIALLSCGLTLTYMTTKVPNFAQGTLSTIGVYIAFTAVRVWKGNPYLFAGLAFGLSGLAGFGLYYFVMKPLLKRGAALVTLMIATVGYDLFLFSLINIYADYLSNVYQVLSVKFRLDSFDFRFYAPLINTDLPGIFLAGPITVGLLTITLHLMLTGTRFGVAMRAAVENPSLAGVVGINIDLVYAVSWFLSGGLAGLAGLFASLLLTGNPDLGIVILPAIFAASVVGGLGNIYGALLGGFIVGLGEIIGTSYVASSVSVDILRYQSLVPLIFLIVTLLVAPRGVTGVDWASLVRRLKRIDWAYRIRQLASR